jgi:hypothetical protein
MKAQLAARRPAALDLGGVARVLLPFASPGRPNACAGPTPVLDACRLRRRKTAPTAAACNSTGYAMSALGPGRHRANLSRNAEGRVSDKTDTEGQAPGHGVVVRAPNGDVIRYDPSGLVMRLSDKVIADIALRLGTRDRRAALGPPADEDALGDVDAWDIRAEGDWLRFTARLAGRQGVRGFRRHVSPAGRSWGMRRDRSWRSSASAGQARRSPRPGAPAYPHHVVAPADDIGAVGMAGIEAAPETDRLEGLRECTHEALVAETLLDWRMEAFAPLPLFVVRAETEAVSTAAALVDGVAPSKTSASRRATSPPPPRPWDARRGSRPSVSTSRWRTCRRRHWPIVTGCWP